MELDTTRERFYTFSLLGNHSVPALYTFLCRKIAEDREILRIAGATAPGQPPPNMLLGAVHFLLLAGDTHPLARYYASCTPAPFPPDEEAWTLFRDFSTANRAQILGILANRSTQTNEAGRCALLLPAFAAAAARFPDSGWHLIEIGASAGFNLNWDAYAYCFNQEIAFPAVVETGVELTVDSFLLPGASLPALDLGALHDLMAMRSGVESHPVDLSSPEDCRWLQALVFPDKIRRLNRLEKAIRIARLRPPPVLQGDGPAMLPELIANTPPGIIPLVYHSFVRYQFSDSKKRSFDNTLRTAGQHRRLAHIAIEWAGTADPTIALTIYSNGRPESTTLGTCHPHGDWLAWNPVDPHH